MAICLWALHFSRNKCNQLQRYGHSIKISIQLFVIHDKIGCTFVLNVCAEYDEMMKNEEN